MYVNSPTMTILSGLVSWGNDQLKSIEYLVHQIALSTIASIVFSMMTALFSPPVFGLGLVIGFVFHHQVKYILRDIQNIFTKDDPAIHHYWSKVANRVSRIGLLSFYFALNMPAALLTASLYFSMQWGMYFRYRAHPNRNNNNNNNNY